MFSRLAGLSTEAFLVREPSTLCNASQDDRLGMTGGGAAVAPAKPASFVKMAGITRSTKPGGNTPKMRAQHGISPTDLFKFHEGKLEGEAHNRVAAVLAGGDSKLAKYSDIIRRQTEISRHNAAISDYINSLDPAQATELLRELCTGQEAFSGMALLQIVNRAFGVYSQEAIAAGKFVVAHGSLREPIQGGTEDALKLARELEIIS